MLAQFLIACVAFLGLIVGYSLTFIAKEEIKPGKKYFMAFARCLLITIGLVLLMQVWQSTWIIPLLLGLLVGIFVQMRYLFLGLAVTTTAMLSKEINVLVASLVFLYGLPYGSSSSKWKLPLHALFFFIPVILMLFFSPNNLNYMIPFIAGALVVQK